MCHPPGGTLVRLWRSAMCSVTTREKGREMLEQLLLNPSFVSSTFLSIVTGMTTSCWEIHTWTERKSIYSHVMVFSSESGHMLKIIRLFSKDYFCITQGVISLREYTCNNNRHIWHLFSIKVVKAQRVSFVIVWTSMCSSRLPVKAGNPQYVFALVCPSKLSATPHFYCHY